MEVGEPRQRRPALDCGLPQVWRAAEAKRAYMRRPLLLVALVLGLAAPAAVAAPIVGGPPVPAPVADAAGVCDPID
ncbi:MAG TPA: hypothetical protein VEA78_05240, partial [Acidimicrobiales bacterium]|nr:hypothetical protein [Acidimicrobiales bacterium]